MTGRQHRPPPLLADARSTAMLFGHAKPYATGGGRQIAQLDPPREDVTDGRSARERMADRRAAALATLEETGSATTSDLAVWVGTNQDVMLRDMHALEQAGEVTCSREIRSGREALVWSRATPDGSQGHE